MPKDATPVEPVKLYGPLREFWLRYDTKGPLEGPFTYYEAEYKARVSTREAARTKVGDISVALITFVGNRPGDPIITPPVEKVVCLYLAGRKTTGGALAQYNVSRGNF